MADVSTALTSHALVMLQHYPEIVCWTCMSAANSVRSNRGCHTFLPLTIHSPSAGRLTVVKAAGPWHTDEMMTFGASRAFICRHQDKIMCTTRTMYKRTPKARSQAANDNACRR